MVQIYGMVTIIELLHVIKNELAVAAEQAINSFDWSAPGVDSGACGDIAEAMGEVIKRRIPTAKVEFAYSGSDFESEPFHTFLRVIDPSTNVVVMVDLPYYHYEELLNADSFDEPNWKLINNKITPEMIYIAEEEDEEEEYLE